MAAYLLTGIPPPDIIVPRFSNVCTMRSFSSHHSPARTKVIANQRFNSLGLVLVAILAWAPTLRAQTPSADLGKTLFMRRGCSGCHAIGKSGRMAGPDLLGVTARRSADWLKSWLKSPDTMVLTDPTAKALYKQYNMVKMPNPKLSDEEVGALIAYLGSQK